MLQLPVVAVVVREFDSDPNMCCFARWAEIDTEPYSEGLQVPEWHLLGEPQMTLAELGRFVDLEDLVQADSDSCQHLRPELYSGVLAMLPGSGQWR